MMTRELHVILDSILAGLDGDNLGSIRDRRDRLVAPVETFGGTDIRLDLVALETFEQLHHSIGSSDLIDEGYQLETYANGCVELGTVWLEHSA